MATVRRSERIQLLRKDAPIAAAVAAASLAAASTVAAAEKSAAVVGSSAAALAAAVRTEPTRQNLDSKKARVFSTRIPCWARTTWPTNAGDRDSPTTPSRNVATFSRGRAAR